MVSSAKLSTTEYTVLGLVSVNGPCTTYVVMKELASSASTFYRNRAATTYRVVQRLIESHLLEPVGEELGARGDRLINITPLGLEELRAWLRPPIAKVEVDHTIDLIRLRIYFLSVITPAERALFLDAAISALSTRVSEYEELSHVPDPFDSMANLGGLLETQARLKWLHSIRSRLLAIP